MSKGSLSFISEWGLTNPKEIAMACAEEAGRITDESEAILSKAEDRELTTGEIKTLDSNRAKVQTIRARQEREQEVADKEHARISKAVLADMDGKNKTSEGYSEVAALKGSGAMCFTNSQKVASAPLRGDKADHPHPVGAIVQAAITGRKNSLDLPIKNVLSEGTDSAGGYTVPTQLSSNIIDKARAASVMNQAGVQTYLTDSDNLTVAKVTGDPTVETKAENAAFSGSDITFGAVSFAPKLVGIYCTASRELAEDSINFTAAVENVMARALAVGLDQLALNGSGSGEMLGILNDSGIGQSTSAGAVAWTTFSSEVDTIRQANYEPNAYICEPAIMHAVMETKDSNNLWLSAPPTLDGIRGYSTSNCASGEAVVGDFSQAAFCMRHGLRVEVSTQAGDVFSKHQVAIKMFMRVDFSTLNDAAFRRISGITAS